MLSVYQVAWKVDRLPVDRTSAVIIPLCKVTGNVYLIRRILCAQLSRQVKQIYWETVEKEEHEVDLLKLG